MEKKNTGLKVFISILSILVVALFGYIVYDKVLNKNTDVENNENNGENNLNRYTAFRQCGAVIYYKPVTNSSCIKGEDGCLGWYVISKDTEQDAPLDLILYKNLGNTVALNENENISEGPITALNYLKSLTQNWQVRVRMSSIDDVASILDVKKMMMEILEY